MCRISTATLPLRRALTTCAALLVLAFPALSHAETAAPPPVEQLLAEPAADAVEDSPTSPGRWRQLLYRSVRNRRALERTLGGGRARQLAELRYRLHRSEMWPEWHFGPDLREREWMADSALSNLGKLVRESILNSGPLGRLRRNVEQQADEFAADHTPDGYDLDARIGVGSKRYLGVEVGFPFTVRRMRGNDRMSLRFQLRHGLDTDRHLLRVRWLAPKGELVVDHRLGDGWHAAETRFGYRHEF